MPTYEYRCKRCGEQFEVVQSFKAKPLRRHECGGDLQKLFHARGVMFKGSGFYSTDSRSGSKSKTKPKSKPKVASSEGSSAQPDSTGGSDE